jgi:hypothetical protein
LLAAVLLPLDKQVNLLKEPLVRQQMLKHNPQH